MLTSTPGSLAHIADLFYQKTRELMVTQSWDCVGKHYRTVDISRDVLKYVPLYWACELVGLVVAYVLRSILI